MRERERHRSALRSEQLKAQLENMKARRVQDRRMTVNENKRLLEEDLGRRDVVRKVR